ncbi:MAG: riboflavin synthase [Clostridiales bacterium]|nr:riboflavin synthase [Clostridiales bacterium]
MFTGWIEETGTVEELNKSAQSAQITIRAEKVLHGLHIGDSIAVNGVCLTVISFDALRFTVDAMAETLRRTNAQGFLPGARVNLERAMRLGDRLGGHIVSGHVDGIGVVRSMKREDNAVSIDIAAPENILKYVAEKGSIAVDGVSLTVARAGGRLFRVCVIPHTQQETTLLQRKPGDAVNLECDLIAKYTEKLLRGNSQSAGITMELLQQHGF